MSRNALLQCLTGIDGSALAFEILACAFAVRFEQFGE
jgi:hypothetical protein